MIKKLYEITLETISNFYQFYNPLDLIHIPNRLIKDLLKYLSVKNLENFERQFFDKTNHRIDTNQIWQHHLKTIWNYMPSDAINDCSSINYYKYRYFEHLFTNTRALEIDLSVKLEQTHIHILNLSLYLIEKYDIKKDRIEYTPMTSIKRNINKESWNSNWNIYIKRLSLAQNIWHMIRDNERFLKNFITNVNTLVLAGYPQVNDVPALKFVIKLLIEGNTKNLVLKFPHKVLLKTIFMLLKNVGKNDVNLTTDDIKYSNNGSITLRNQIMKYGSRSVLWKNANRRNNSTRNYLSNLMNTSNSHRNSRQRASYDFSLQNLTHINNNSNDHDARLDLFNRYESRSSVSSIHYFNDELIDQRRISLHRSPQLLDETAQTVVGSSSKISSSLFTIDEDLSAQQSTDSKLIYSIPKNNNLRFLSSLEIHSVHHRSKIELIGSSLLEMSFIENLTISYLNFYSKELEDALVMLISQDRLKSLSLTNVRFINGAGGFVYKILTEKNYQRTKSSSSFDGYEEPRKLEILKLDLIKSQNFDPTTVLNTNKECKKLFLKKLVWKETEFTYSMMKIIEIVLKNSEYLEYLELKSILLSTYLGLCMNEIGKSCKHLSELKIKQFSFNQLNEFDYMLHLIEKNQLIVLYIDSCEIFESYIQSKKFEDSLSHATNLQTLSLLKLSLSDESISKVCESFSRMSSNYSLKNIDLSGNLLTTVGIKKLCDTIKELRTNSKYSVTHLKLNDNTCSIDSLIELKKHYLNIIFNF